MTETTLMSKPVYAVCPECYSKVKLTSGETVTGELFKYRKEQYILLTFVCSNCGVEQGLEEGCDSNG